MRSIFKAAIAAMALAGASASATPATAQSFGLGIGPNGGITFDYDSGGYCDDWGCPDDFWDMPVYYGAVYYGGRWYEGPLYYRDWYGGRQFWIRGAWRYEQWRGPRPGWYHTGRFGPALGFDFYRNNHDFHGRWDRYRDDRRDFRRDDRRDNRGFGPRDDNRRDFGPRGDNRPNFGPRGDDRRNFGPRDNDRRDDRRGLDRREGFNGPSNNQPDNNGFGRGRRDRNVAPDNAPAAAPNPAPQGGGFDPRLGRSQRPWRQDQQQPAATPNAAAPAGPPPDNDGGRRGGGRGRHGRD